MKTQTKLAIGWCVGTLSALLVALDAAGRLPPGNWHSGAAACVIVCGVLQARLPQLWGEGAKPAPATPPPAPRE